jgi:protein-tyrosine-phosphatase
MKRTGPDIAPYNILILCVGNICRSPFAEKLLSEKLPADKFPANVFSRGTMAERGVCSSEEAVAAARSLGIDLSGHRSRPLAKEDLMNADIILTMDSQTAENLNEAHELNDLAIPMGRFHPSSVVIDIADPYGKGIEAYLDCYKTIIECVDGFVRFYSE